MGIVNALVRPISRLIRLIGMVYTPAVENLKDLLSGRTYDDQEIAPEMAFLSVKEKRIDNVPRCDSGTFEIVLDQILCGG